MAKVELFERAKTRILGTTNGSIAVVGSCFSGLFAPTGAGNSANAGDNCFRFPHEVQKSADSRNERFAKDRLFLH